MFNIIEIRINILPTTIPEINIVLIFSIGLINFCGKISSFPKILPYKNPKIIEEIPPATITGPIPTFFLISNIPIKKITAPCPTSPNINPNIINAVIATNNVGSISLTFGRPYILTNISKGFISLLFFSLVGSFISSFFPS